MRTRVGALALTVVLTACGSSAGPAASTTSPTTSPATTGQPTTTTSTEWSGRLLTVADVGSEWKAGPEINSADLESFAQLPCPDTALNPTIAARLTGVAGVQFEPVDQSYRHLIEMGLSGDPARLAADLEALVGAFDACAQSTVTVAGEGKIDVQPLALGNLGDQRAGFVITAGEGGGSTAVWHMRTAIVRVGPRAIGIGLAEILSSPTDTLHYTDADFTALVQKAVAKLG